MILNKQQLRADILQRLRNKSAEERQLQSADLRRLLTPWLENELPLAVAIYAPLPHEVNLLPLLAEYPQHHYYLPRCGREGRMTFHRVTTPQQLTPGALGIPTPPADLPTIQPENLKLIIVPGVAFTPSGKRLGYGGGFYDRFLPCCSRAQIVAVAYPEQIIQDIPTEAHDLLIPRILTLPQ